MNYFLMLSQAFGLLHMLSHAATNAANALAVHEPDHPAVAKVAAVLTEGTAALDVLAGMGGEVAPVVQAGVDLVRVAQGRPPTDGLFVPAPGKP